MGLAIAAPRLGAQMMLIATPKATHINGIATAAAVSSPIHWAIPRRAATRPNVRTHLKISFAGSSLRLTERTISQIKVAKAPSNINRPAAMERARGMDQPFPTRRLGRFPGRPSYPLFPSGLGERLIGEFGSGRTRAQPPGRAMPV